MKTKPIGVFLTDTHLKKENHALVRNIFNQAADLAISLKVKNIYFGGDAFTNRISQNLDTLLVFNDILEDLDEKGITLFAIPGNHDKTDQDSTKSYLDVYRKHDNFKLIKDQEIIIDFDNNVAIALLPYFTASYKTRLKELNLNRKELKSKGFKTILITHKGFNGVKNNDGSVVEDGISPAMVKNWDIVIVGHYHDSSIVGKNIHYVGSGYQGNYGENIDDKGFSIIYSDATIKKVVSDFPIFAKYELGMNDDIEDELAILENNLDIESNNVRIIFKGKKEDLHKINKSKLEEKGIDVKFEYDEISEEILKAESGDIVIVDRNNLTTYFKEFCDVQEIPKNKMLKGLKLLLNDF